MHWYSLEDQRELPETNVNPRVEKTDCWREQWQSEIKSVIVTVQRSELL